MFEEIFFQLRSNRTTIDCNLFDIEILFKNFLLVFQTKTKQNKVFLRGGKKTKCSITKKRNVDIPIGYWPLVRKFEEKRVPTSNVCEIKQKLLRMIFHSYIFGHLCAVLGARHFFQFAPMHHTPLFQSLCHCTTAPLFQLKFSRHSISATAAPRHLILAPPHHILGGKFAPSKNCFTVHKAVFF